MSPVAQNGMTNHQRSHDIFQQREFREQMIKLKDESEDVVSQLISCLLIEIVDAIPVQQMTSPTSGESSSPITCSRVLLPEPLWPITEMNSPRLSLQAGSLKHRNLVLTFEVRLGNRFGGNQGTIHFQSLAMARYFD
jgi:hypothetical protein